MEIYTHRHAVEQWKHYAIDQTGYSADELPYSNLSIVRNLQETRAGEVRMALANGIQLSEFMVQTLGCVELEELDRSECPCAPASGCYWLRSKKPIPRYIEMISVTGIVANTDNPRFSFIKWDRFQYIPKSRALSVRKGRYWTIKDTGEGEPYLYLYGDRFLKVAAVSAIWEDPMCVEAYPRCDEVNMNAFCDPLDVDLYTDSWLRDVIITKSWQKLLTARSSAGADILQDDNTGNNPLNTQV